MMGFSNKNDLGQRHIKLVLIIRVFVYTTYQVASYFRSSSAETKFTTILFVVKYPRFGNYHFAALRSMYILGHHFGLEHRAVIFYSPFVLSLYCL